MADKNQLKIANQVDLSDDDPFAELTRIMGFDPRQPAKRPEPAPVQPLSRLAPVGHPAPAEQIAEEEDFSLDLEKELLGGFDLEEEQYAQPSQDLPVDDASAPAFADVDFDFGDTFEAASTLAPHEPAAIAEDDFSFDSDLDAAFAAVAPNEDTVSEASWQDPNDIELDFGLTDEDVGALDDVAAAAPVPVPALPVTPQAVAVNHFDAEFDDALADIDMSFLDSPAEPHAPEEVSLSTEADTRAEAPEAEPADLDFNLFEDSDFRLADETPAPAIQEIVPEVEEAFPEIGAEPFDLSLDELRLEEFPVAEAAPQPQDEISFDNLDFDAVHYEQDFGPVAVAVPVEEPVLARSEPIIESPAPVTASNFELSVPAYVPRKLPTSPMDVAAEAFRQREAPPAEPEFNLEDELNALLGNKKAAPVEVPVVAQPAPAFEAPSFTPSYSAPSYSAPESYRSSTADVFGTSGATAYQPIEAPRPEPVAFEAPVHPADIDDNLNWELDEAFASESDAAPADQDIAYADDYSHATYQENAGPAETYRDFEPAYGARYDAEPVDLDLAFDELIDEPLQPEPAIPYREAFAGAAIGAAAARLGSPQPPRSVADEDHFSPHRDPVVRGNPLTEDPLDIITQLAEKYSRKEPEASYGSATAASYGQLPEDEVDGDIDISDLLEEQPDVETVEVNDQAIALADDLDIPELPEEEDYPAAAAYDDLDAEFSSLLNDISTEPAAAQASAGYQDPLAGGFNARAYQARPYENPGVVATPAGARPAPAHPAPARTVEDEFGQGAFSLDTDDLYGRPSSGAQYADAYDYDPEFEQEIAPQQFAERPARKSPSRGLLIAGILGGVVLVGAIGAFALSFGGGSSGDAPTIVKADEGPVKVRPENPGGTTVPNQDSKVYDTVSGETGNGEAPQEKLVTTAEEPMDVAPPAMEEDPVTASGKSEDRIEQIVEDAAGQTDAELTAVAPRKVRTMVVKPDGTLVPREDDVEMAPSNEQTEAIAAVAPSETESTGALPESAPALAPVPEQTASVPAPVQTAGIPDAAESGTTPDTAPLAPLRPAEQPVDVVGEVASTQVAAATTNAATAGASWAMQIASQPSEAAAQSSYKDLVRRYGSVLQGREANIVKAEIAGKGTFWRVRVPAGTRAEAINLCETYKAAGGNCFVSR